MSNNPAQTASQWVDSIDIKGDKIADTTSPEVSLKDSLKKDLQVLWTRKNEGKITDEEYNKYANAAKVIFEKQNISFSVIRKEYMKERTKTLKESNTFLENLSLDVSNVGKKVRNLATDGMVLAQQKFISEDTIQSYTEEEGNSLIEVKVFEEQLKNKPLEEINGLALKNYLTFLQKKTPITKELLEQKLGSPKRLLELSILWGSVFGDEMHMRGGGHGKAAKMFGTAKMWITGTTEKKIKDGIFKKVIVDNIKMAGLESSVFDKKKDQKRSREELGKKLNGMDYNAVMKEMKDEFPKGQKITTEMIGKFFERKVAKEEKVVDNLEVQQNHVLGHKTVGEILKESDLSRDFLGDGLKDKAFSSLNSFEKKKLLDTVQENGNGISEDVRSCITSQGEIDQKRGTIEELRAVAKDAASTETFASLYNNKKGDNVLADVLRLSVASSKSEKKLLSKEEIYKEILGKIGYSEIKFTDIIHNSAILNDVIGKLETNKLTNTEIYTDLKKHLKIEVEKADNYNMATKNITKEELSEAKRQGLYTNGFASELYKEDLRLKRTTDFTVPQELKVVSRETQNNNQTFMTGDMTTRLSAIYEEGKRIPLEKIGNDTCFVSREGNSYILSINGNTEKCSGKDEVEKTIDAYTFFYDIGLKSVTPYINNFLAIIQEKNPTCPKFDIQKGICPEQQEILLGAVDRIFNLNMELRMSEKSTKAVLPDFTEMLRAIDQKHGLNASLRKKGILTHTGSLSEKALKETLFMNGPVLA